MKNFIAALQRPLSTNTGCPIQELEYNFDLDTYKAIFKKAKEHTSSSPSGIHYGHYIAAIQNDLLAEVNVTFMRVPFAHGFPLDRWSSSVHCMLQKKKVAFIDKLRIIQLFEADFNSALKYVLGRRLLYYSEEQGLNSNQTHGSRPGRSTHDALKINTLTYDIARLDRTTMITLFNDAAGCYDRMRHNLTTITTRHMGCPKSFALCHARVQNTMKHFVKTTAGTLKEYFQASALLNIGGLGQGNGGGPIS